MPVHRLSRSLSPAHIFAFTFGCIIGWGAYVMPGDQCLPQAGPLGSVIAMVIAGMVAIIISCNYAFMVRHHWTDGGELSYASMAFGPRHGMVCGWFMVLAFVSIVPMNATALSIIGRDLFGSLFQWKYLYSVAGFEIYLGEVLLAAYIVALLAFLSNSGVKRTANVMLVLIGISLLCILVVFLAAVFGPKNRVFTSTPAFNPDVNPFIGILAILAVSPWALLGFNAPSHTVEEIGTNKKGIHKIVIAAIVLGVAIYIIVTLLSASTFPLKYRTWPDYIRNLRSHEGWQALPAFYASSQALGQTGVVMFGIAAVFSTFTAMLGFFMIGSRLLYIMARRHSIPKIFAKVHSKYHTPNVAILFIMVIGMIAPLFGRNALRCLVPMCSLGAAIGYGYTSAAALKFAIKERNLPVCLSGVFGIAMSLILLVFLFFPSDKFACAFTKEAYVCLAIWVVLGIVFHFVAKASEKRRRQMKAAAAAKAREEA